MNFEEYLQSRIDEIPASRVAEAMRYSLMAGGKRIRPNLLFAVLKGYGINPEKGNNLAAALEMIHTYSLIHDDLPCMDNDELRRGKPTCHIQFDETTAVLAGDGLLTYAFETASQTDIKADELIRCIRILSESAGPAGMILGQDLDTVETIQTEDWNKLEEVHHHKTGDLLAAPLMIAAAMAEKDEKTIQTWKSIGYKIGLAFQVQDDILDVTETPQELGKTNSDERNSKITSVSIWGIEKAAEIMNQLYDEVCMQIAEIKDFNSEVLVNLIRGIQTRNK